MLPFSLLACGFSQPRFLPFLMPFELERPKDPMDITSYTVNAESVGHLSFRGVLYQPWCHLIAQKVS